MIKSPKMYTKKIRGPTAKEMAARWDEGGLEIPMRAAKAVKSMMDAGDVQGALEEASVAMGGFGWSQIDPGLWYVDMQSITERTLCFDGREFYIGATIDYIEAHQRRRR